MFVGDAWHDLDTTVLPTTTPTATSLAISLLSEVTPTAQQDVMAAATMDVPRLAGSNIIHIHGRTSSTGKSILIGMLSAFGSAALFVFLFALVYFFRHTSRGRILLDRFGRPGEYDDEQALAREEAEALEEMDDFQRAEYMRAKGM